jgi:eukaryotic-like serine/threonine-protein kinase
LDTYGHAVAQNRGAVIGTLLSGRFRLEERVGSGGMSTVYRAFDETLERWVAIKILQNEIAEDDDQLERFRREARSVARLNHPHVVTVIDAGEDQGCPYIVFEYISGETLKERIRRLGRLPVPEALAYAIEIARALQAAHAERLVHRDVKPQNVLLDTDGRAKVTDFGIARSLEGGEGLTLAGRVLGTTDYVSPEQALGQEVTPQSDIYSLGIVLYEMLTGDVPFRADAPVAVAMKHVREPMPDVQLARPEVSANTAAIVDYATAKETRNRYQTIEQMLNDLEGALALEAARVGQTSGEATTVLRALPEEGFRVPWRLRFPRRAAALTALVAGMVAVALVLILSRTHETKSPTATPPQPKGAAPLVAMKLPPNAAHDYDPIGGDGEHPTDTPKAIDHNALTAWTTETYDSGIPQTKPGVGLYVDTTTPVAARRLDIISRQSPYSAQILAASGEFAPPKIESWTPVSATVAVNGVSRIPLDTKGKTYRFYLVWINKLPAGGKGGINELTLNR